jgi:5'-3' exonuclease
VSEPPRRLFLLDGHSLAYRAFFALPQTLATSSGTVTNAVYGFTSMLIKLFGDEHPDLIAVAFDMGAPTVRLEMDADYKAGRAESPADFRPQLGLIEEVLDVLRIPVIRMAGHEADDAIGTLAIRASEAGLDAVIVTADRDFFQLVRDREKTRGAISVLFNRRGISEIDLMDPAAVEGRYGITPAQYLDFVALKGDTSDNIPGVPGIGDKTASKLVNQFGTIEELLARTDELKGKQKENIEAAADRLALNKQLARIVTDLELEYTPEDCVMGASDPEQVRSLFVSLEFRSLLDRLAEARPPAGGRGAAARGDEGRRGRRRRAGRGWRDPWGCGVGGRRAGLVRPGDGARFAAGCAARRGRREADARCEGARACRGRARRRSGRRDVRHVDRRLPARPGYDGLRARSADRALPRNRPARRHRGRRRRAAVRGRPMAADGG